MAGVHALEDLLEECPAELFVLLAEDGGIEVRQYARGNELIVLYTNLDALVHWCGEGQPHARASTVELVNGAPAEGISMAAVDLPIPEGHRYPLDVRDNEPIAELPKLPEPSDSVWVPARPAAGRDQVRLELHPDDAGVLVLGAYTSPEQLYACCGEYQQALIILAEDLPRLAEGTGAGYIAYNPVIREQARHTTPVLDWTR